VLVASAGGLAGFFVLLPVVPLYATTAGAGTAGAGLTTAALLFATVAAELVSPRLVGRFGYRPVFAVGLLLLGVPALALAASAQLVAILAVSLVRGLGFGIVVVLGSALVAELVPPQRRGEGLGLYGVVIGAPGVLALPFGVFLIGHTGYLPVFVAAAVVALAGLLALPGEPGARIGRGRDHRPDQDGRPARDHPPDRGGPPDRAPVGIRAGLRRAALLRPAVVFAATAVAGGVVVTFLPLAVPGGSGSLAAAALLAQAVTGTLARWWAGRYGDRRGSARLVVPGLLIATAGVLALVLTGSPVAVLAGAALFGVGFGVCQNASLAVMFDRVGQSGYGTVSAIWNLAFDAGMGLGAAGFGVLVTYTGYPVGFAVTGALMLVALVPARWDQRVPPR
jgi:MFS family permease